MISHNPVEQFFAKNWVKEPPSFYPLKMAFKNQGIRNTNLCCLKKLVAILVQKLKISNFFGVIK
jgi:hypothetical protein